MEHIFDRIEGWFTFPELYKSMVEMFPSGSHFVEVGTWMGRSASFMAVEINNSDKDIKFDCVDTWKGSEEHNNPSNSGYHSSTQTEDGLYSIFLRNIEPIKHLIKPVRLPSLEAAKEYADNSLDFVFIDASHDYDNVRDDIKAWYPKVKSGGVFAGHDYPGWEGVRRAVDEFISDNSYELFICSEGSWGIKKR